MATAAAAAGVMNPSLLAASFHAANFNVPNNTESQNEMGNIMERDSSARSSVLLLPPYMSSFTQVSGLIIEYQLNWCKHQVFKIILKYITCADENTATSFFARPSFFSQYDIPLERYAHSESACIKPEPILPKSWCRGWCRKKEAQSNLHRSCIRGPKVGRMVHT